MFSRKDNNTSNNVPTTHTHTISGFHAMEKSIMDLQKSLRTKKIIGFVPIILVVCLVVAMFIIDKKYEEYKAKNNGQLIMLQKTVDSLNSKLDPSGERVAFISKADAVISSSSSQLTTSERTLLTNAIWNNSREFNVDPYLMLAVAKVESAFDKNAVSDKGAKGTFQMIPSTFNMCAAMLHENRSAKTDIFDIEAQARYATFYLRLLYDDCNDYNLALARYNMGHCNYITEYTIKVNRTAEELR